jgi:hypothetical protein
MPVRGYDILTPRGCPSPDEDYPAHHQPEGIMLRRTRDPGEERRDADARPGAVTGGRHPNFLVIGAQKAGTTSLWHYLIQHPQIELSAQKELHYFDREEDYPDHDWYRSHFTGDRPASGEITPIYCYWPGAIKRIHAFQPTMRLIFILRNPIDRAISHYWMEYQREQETLSLRDALEAEEARLATGLPVHLRQHSYLARGVYHEQLARIYRYFPREQVLVLVFESLTRSPQTFLSRITRFLAVDVHAFHIDNAYRVGDYPPPDPALYAHLQDYFAPHNRILAERYGLHADWI